MKKKRRNLTKQELLFKLKCNEAAAKNVRQFMAGEVSLEDLMRKVYGTEKAIKSEDNVNDNEAK